MDCSYMPLLGKEKEEYTLTDYEDSSSGYDSTDISDTESISSIESRDSYSNLASFQRSRQEVMSFRSTSNLCSNLRLILQMPDLCDVTFLVGPEETPVHGVRAILGTRSCVFYQLILKHQALMHEEPAPVKKKSAAADKKPVGLMRGMGPRLTIPVKKYEPAVFEKLVEFVHCGSVNITEDSVIGLYCGAVQFRLQDLSAACMDFVERCLAGGRCEPLLSSVHANSHHTAAHTIADMIHSHLSNRSKDTTATM